MANLGRVFDGALGEIYVASFARALLLGILAGVAGGVVIHAFAPSFGSVAYIVICFTVFTYSHSGREVGVTRARRLLGAGASGAIFGALMWAFDRWL